MSMTRIEGIFPDFHSINLQDVRGMVGGGTTLNVFQIEYELNFDLKDINNFCMQLVFPFNLTQYKLFNPLV